MLQIIHQHTEIRLYFHKTKESAQRILFEGKREHLNAQDGGKSTYMKPLSMDERSSF